MTKITESLRLPFGNDKFPQYFVTGCWGARFYIVYNFFHIVMFY